MEGSKRTRAGRACGFSAPKRRGRRLVRRAAVLLTLPAVFVLALLAVACGAARAPDVPPARILLIGNSFTAYNGGIDQELSLMAPSASVSAVTAGGYQLRSHWDAGEALARIRSGAWDYVVLQEQSLTPVFAYQTFAAAAGSFDREVRAAGGTTVLLMTWERPDYARRGLTTAALAAAYQAVGTSLGARVAPAGLAFAEALRRRPELTLCASDGHPTEAGTYLATCVLYGTIYGRSPAGLPDGPLSGEDAAFLQGVAADTLRSQATAIPGP